MENGMDKNIRIDKLELLSPAGGMDSLIAAAQAGADAVYFGGGAFNARRLAKNFNGDELKAAVEYLKLRKIRSYITFNTLMLDRELEEALKYAAFLYDIGADAVIVQDIGLVSLLKSELPGLELHASTQMGIHTPEGARMAMELGMKRVVLSREAPLKDIPAIAAAGAEVEAFAQGALCMSFSGGCLFSSMAGERSGNRGTCAQPCRKLISINGSPGRDDYQLSLSDLCMIEHLEDMRRAGVCCIKLEGRMKRPEYVAAVTRAYRLALDGCDWREALAAANGIFFRESRTGYYYGDNAVTGCVAQSRPDSAALKTAAAYFAGENRARPASFSLTARAGERAALTVCCDGSTVVIEGDIAEKANSDNSERYCEQLRKLGGTAFYAKTVSVDAQDGFLPVSKVNEMRRRAVERLALELSHPNRAAASPRLGKLPEHERRGFELLARVRTEAQAEAALLSGAKMIALAPFEYRADALKRLQYIRQKSKLLLALPAVMMGEAERGRIESLLASGALDGAVAENLGQYELISRLPVKIAGPKLNAMNAHAVQTLYNIGFDRVILSEELTKPQLRDILSTLGGGMRIYGRTELMQLMHCPNREYSGCARCTGGETSPAAVMTDEAGRRFELSNVKQAGGCLVRLLNSAVTDLTDVYRQAGPEFAELSFSFEEPERVGDIVRLALATEDTDAQLSAGRTRGHWARAVD